jgi:hypothetical protein
LSGDRDAQGKFACQPSFEKFARPSRRAQFLNTMDAVVPWSELETLIEPHYPKAGSTASKDSRSEENQNCFQT